MQSKIMTHVVAGYPNREQCINLLMDMQSAGVFAVEVQIPFSDPGADGEVIMHANDSALQSGMTIADTFTMIDEVRGRGLVVPVYVMTYLNKPFSYGIKKFCEDTVRSGVTGLIIPDMPCDSEEYQAISTCCARLGLELVPVLSPLMSIDNLEAYDLINKTFVYLTSTKGITGKQFQTNENLEDLIASVRKASPCLIGLGFGIRTATDVQEALLLADVAVIGSEVIRIIDQKGVSHVKRYIKNILDQLEV